MSPVFKDGDAEELGNYRPISIISVTAKNFEKLIYNPRGGGGRGVTCICRDTGNVPLFWVLFWGCSRIFGYLFRLFQDFWVSFLAISGFLGIIFW